MQLTTNTDFRLVLVLAGLSAHYGKNYCIPTQDKICELIQRFYNRTMSRRTLNRHLDGLEAGGWIHRQRRHQYHPVKGWTFRSTLYTITRRARRTLGALRGFIGRVAGNPRPRSAREPCANSGTILVSTRQDHRRPPPPGSDPPQCNKVATENVAQLKKILHKK